MVGGVWGCGEGSGGVSVSVWKERGGVHACVHVCVCVCVCVPAS